jgi:hypothetical protein
VKLSWRNDALVLEPESAKDSSALMRLAETLLLLGAAWMHREQADKPPSHGDEEK